MSDTSARLSLPLLQAGQAQKEIYHNEALALIDLAVAASAEAVGTNDPPGAPDPGQCWIVGSAPTGAWSGRAGAVAGWTGGGWRFVAAPEGMLVWIAADGLWARRTGGAWVLGDLPASSVSVGGVQVIGGQAGAIASPSGGTIVDAEVRIAVTAILAAMRGHGLIAT